LITFEQKDNIRDICWVLLV